MGGLKVCRLVSIGHLYIFKIKANYLEKYSLVYVCEVSCTSSRNHMLKNYVFTPKIQKREPCLSWHTVIKKTLVAATRQN